ncbi:MAG: aromatic ring-hydroxylating dioxygenase subunit alpha [Alcaligenes aquatilis]
MTTALRSPIAIEEFDRSYFQQETDEVFALPPECFNSEEFFQFELNAVWKKQWFCVGRATDIPNAGDFFTFDVGNDALFAIRTREGGINVLSNVCRHRNMLLLEGAGNVRRISCPLHAWVYNMEGELVSAPGLTDTGASFDPKSVCLPKIRAEVWEGFIFINYDAMAPALHTRLGNLGKQLANYRMSELKSSEPLKMESFDWNWKILNDECYHCSFLHASSWGGMYETNPDRVDETAVFNDVANGIVSYNLLSTHKDAAPTHTGSILQPPMNGLTDQERTRLSYVTVAPNLLLVAMPDKVKYFMWLPKSAKQSTYGVSWMYPQETLEREDHKEKFDQEHDDLYPVMIEDLFAWRRSHQGMQSNFASRGRLTNEELVIKRLQNWLIDLYRAEERRADEQSRVLPIRAIA